MIAEDLLAELERVADVNHPGTIEIQRVWHPTALPWSVSISCGEVGYGTGNTLTEAIEDALTDRERDLP